jgi:hypothetical protein
MFMGHGGIAMNQRRRAKVTARQDSYYQPSLLMALLALILAMLLAWHGMAHADSANRDADAPGTDAVMPLDAGPGDAAPGQTAPGAIGLPCSDQMDFSPEDNLPDPFDADSVAWHNSGAFHVIRPAMDGVCSDVNPSRTA